VIHKIILGTVQFGFDYGINNFSGKPSEIRVFGILENSLNMGVNILDTADAYGNAIELIGKYNQTNPGKFIINTKFIKSDKTLKTQLQNTLRLLQIQCINVYFYHRFEDFEEYPELLDELVSLKKEGLINKIGLSVYENTELKKAIETEEIDVIQLPFNLLDNYAQRGFLLKLAKKNAKKIQARSVFLQGLFFRPLNKVPSTLSALIPYLEVIRSIAKVNNITTEHLALQYVIQQSEIDNVVIGVDNCEQLKKNLSLAYSKISDKILEAVNEIRVNEIRLLYPKNWK